VLKSSPANKLFEEFIMKTITSKFSNNEISILVKLAIPLIITGFTESSVGFFTTFFLARLGTKELAAGAVVQWIFFTMLVILWGTMTAVSVIVSRKFGERDESAIARALRDGLILSVVLFVPSFFILRWLGPLLLEWGGQSQETITMAKIYMNALSWGLLGDFIQMTFLQFLIGLGHTRTNLVFTFLWVPMNIFFNYILIFGKFGVPAFGIAGVGWGTTIAFTFSAVILFAYFMIEKKYRKYMKAMFNNKGPSFLGELLHVGLPMGSMYCIEIAFFLTMTLIMGKFGSAYVAANQINMQFMGQLSVVTFSIAQAITVRMGHTLGAREVDKAKRALFIGMGMAIIFIFGVACCDWFIPQKFIGIDLDLNLAKNQETILLAKQFMAIGAFFILVEAVRIPLFGSLRALNQTRFTLLASIISFWGISLPLGYFMAIEFSMKGAGLWWGCVFGQAVGAFLLYLRFRYKIRSAAKRESLHAFSGTPSA
jgi:MATE family multidrug resistance protein